MSLPVSLTDFFTLTKYCRGLGQRIQSLGDDYRHLKARAEVLSLVFAQVHEALLKFDNIPKEFQAIFTDLRTSCYLSLCQIESTLEQFEILKTDNPAKRKARKFAMAVHNSVDNLRGKLRDQFVILSLMVLWFSLPWSLATRPDAAAASDRFPSEELLSLFPRTKAVRIEYRNISGAG
ncbi:hypothetical protein DL763_001609 [Monosporascus cannonballus]|nr:hypothetical protein DL763_001609 [Monosporascus cannonballus]